jgi:hypothetical protein
MSDTRAPKVSVLGSYFLLVCPTSQTLPCPSITCLAAPVSREIFGHNQSSSHCSHSKTRLHVHIFWFFLLNTRSVGSKLVGNFLGVLYSNRVFLKLNWCTSTFIVLSNQCGLPFGVTHCYNILPRVSFFNPNDMSC